jgi:hypothetical protein
MKNSILITVILLALSINLASALFESTDANDYVTYYNNDISNAPSVLRSLVGNERVDINIIMNNGSVYEVGFETEDARIVRTVPGGIEDPTITVDTTESAINSIKSSSDPVGAFETARNYGQVEIEGHTITTKAKLALALSSTSVIRFFYEIFFGGLEG